MKHRLLDRDGHPIKMAWMAAESTNGFLAFAGPRHRKSTSSWPLFTAARGTELHNVQECVIEANWRRQKGKALNSYWKSARIAVLTVPAIFCFIVPARAQIFIGQLAGPWKIAIGGNTQCGQTSMLFSGTLNSSGTAVGTLTEASGCGTSSSTQTFKIISLNTQGTGTAGLTFGPGCGWTFDIQVDANTEVLNLVDVNNGSANVLAGIAIHEGPIFQ